MMMAALGPTAWVVLSSFSTATQIYAGRVIPDHFSVAGYRFLLSGGDIVPPMLNTLVCAICGTGYFTIVRRIVFPLSRPAVVTVAVVVFISIWNEFMFALTLAPSTNLENVQVALSTFKAQFQFDITAMLAGTTVSHDGTDNCLCVPAEARRLGPDRGCIPIRSGVPR